MPVTRIEKLEKWTGVLEGGSVNFGWDGRSGRDDFTWLWLQKELVEFRTEFGYCSARRSAIPSQTSDGSGFTSTSVPMYAGKFSLDQYRQVFEAIVCSNGWDGVTAALQLVSHLEGDALKVALLVPASAWVLPGVLVGALSEHYGSPGSTDVSLRGPPGVRATIHQCSLYN